MSTQKPTRHNKNPIAPILTDLIALPLVMLLPWLTLADAKAEPVVIYDSGKARPITEFIAPPKRPETAPAQPIEQAGQAFLSGLFPLHTPELTPGPVTASTVNLLLPQPFFILGTDTLSQRWLGDYRARLKQLGAVGLVVEAPSLEAYQALKVLAGDLFLAPVSAPEVAQQLGLSHYPVLITATRIEQ